MLPALPLQMIWSLLAERDRVKTLSRLQKVTQKFPHSNENLLKSPKGIIATIGLTSPVHVEGNYGTNKNCACYEDRMMMMEE